MVDSWLWKRDKRNGKEKDIIEVNSIKKDIIKLGVL
jgi:hypothetical protein